MAVKSLPAEFYSAFLSDAAKERKPSPIRGLYPLEARPGVISLLAGKPNATTFPLTSEIETEVSGEALAEGLQYGPTRDPEPSEWAVATMVNTGDAVLIECPAYAGVLPMFQALHCDLIEVETDAHGIKSSSLRSIFKMAEGKPMPRSSTQYLVMLDLVWVNPTGMTATLDRRREVLALAREYNFIILEDDPYYFLYYGDAARYPSYFTLELEQPEVGRVLRFDSLSKILSSGIRMTAVANLQTSSLTQAIAFSLLDAWGYDGFKTHTEAVSRFYREKQWSTPEAGMFFWFKLLLAEDGEEGDSESVIRTKAYERGVLALPGTVSCRAAGRRQAEGDDLEARTA
ncbi:pyridoxal phosphate-dependent transferase [Fomitopsis serialis]|uniref:pyridoxal phosphate-dependent transferase n=1 Tax=Fomitopsis serialis TaxID=139415 RepID=UPI002007DE22|nr:pyridoxal phosphate-dependent transferase [Neoantrodia serialis]KAH9928351.1 pyridoxal phosphate-dependent transferase [Neoantrodia serialis]